MERGSGDSSFILHESFKDLKTRRAEQEAYRKALEEQIMQRKMRQEEERQREQDEARKMLHKQHCQYRNENVQSSQQTQSPVRENVGFPSTPTSFRRQQQPSPSHHNGIENPDLQASSPKLPSTLHVPIKGQDGLMSPPLFPKFQGGEGRMFHTLHQVENFNEPHPAALARTTEECYNDSTAVNTNVVFPPSSTLYSPRPNLPTSDIRQDCKQFQCIQQTIPDFTLPATPTHQKQNYPQPSQHPPVQCHPSQPSIPMVSASVKSSSSHSPAQNYDNNPMPIHAFSSGSTSESSSYEDVSVKPSQAPKVHVSQTYEQLQSSGVKVSRSQYRAELQLQIDERRKREAEQRKKEQEAEERIQEKIRIEQEKMQKEYEEELRKQQEKELEAEKKRLLALGKPSEITKAEKKMKVMEKKLSMQSPSQREVWHVNMKTNEYDNVGENELCANPSESKESIDSICDFFDETMTSPQSNRQENILNPDDRIVPAVANRLKEETLRRKSLENIEDTTCHGEASYGPRAGYSSSSQESTGEIPLNITLDTCDREIAIRSAPAPNLSDDFVVGPPKGHDFLSSLKNYLEDEKTKLMERIEARSSKSNEGF